MDLYLTTVVFHCQEVVKGVLAELRVACCRSASRKAGTFSCLVEECFRSAKADRTPGEADRTPGEADRVQVFTTVLVVIAESLPPSWTQSHSTRTCIKKFTGTGMKAYSQVKEQMSP